MAEQLGTDERGQPVLSMVHHSRNSASKQWDETWVLALNSVTRLFRTFLPLLQQRLPAARFEQACHPSPSPNPSPNPNPDPDPTPTPNPNPDPNPDPNPNSNPSPNPNPHQAWHGLLGFCELSLTSSARSQEVALAAIGALQQLLLSSALSSAAASVTSPKPAAALATHASDEEVMSCAP